VLEWYARSNLRFTRSQFTLWLGEGYLATGELELARAAAEDVLTASGETGYRHLEALARQLLGESFLESDTPAASRYIDESVEALRRSGARNHLARALVTQAAVRRRQGDGPGARTALEESLAIFEEMGTLYEPERVREALAMLDADDAGGRVDNQ